MTSQGLPRVVARAPGRVNLIGDHTDYTGGLVLPMAIDWATTVSLERGGDVLELVSTTEPEPARLRLGSLGEPSRVEPPWARYVAGVLAVVRPDVGGVGTVETELPVGAGLSSSAALEVALALALGFRGSSHELAAACQEAEHLASGVPTGIMDQLASAAGVTGHALLIDCQTLEIEPVPLPEGAQVVVVDSGQRRALVSSAYGERRRQCEEAAAIIGPLRDASGEDVATLDDPLLRRRARHVVGENARVRDFARALRQHDLEAAGALMLESHASLRDDFEVSTPELDRLVASLRETPGVYGARLTGAGFGGCVVVLADPGSPVEGWRFQAAAGATVSVAA
ncbi:MAG: galactokinase [Actinomycetota bacterium]|nr:galactokinase [Actinomycetota bacterium]